MTIMTENLLRLYGGGYGSEGRADPYTLHAALLAQGRTGLEAKQLKEQLGIQKKGLELQEKRLGMEAEQFEKQYSVSLKNLERLEKELDNLMSQRAFERGTYFLEGGYGTESERRKFSSQYGFTQQPDRIGLVGPSGVGTAATGGASSLSELTNLYHQLGPYSYQPKGVSQINIYDPTLARLRKAIGSKLTSYGAGVY